MSETAVACRRCQEAAGVIVLAILRTYEESGAHVNEWRCPRCDSCVAMVAVPKRTP